jgi:hypothetical protein
MCVLTDGIEDHRQFLAAGYTRNLRYEILFRIEDGVFAAVPPAAACTRIKSPGSTG